MGCSNGKQNDAVARAPTLLEQHSLQTEMKPRKSTQEVEESRNSITSFDVSLTHSIPEEVVMDDGKLEGSVLLLTHSIANGGTLFLHYVEDVNTVDWESHAYLGGPLAYCMPTKPIPKFKFKSLATSRVELSRNATGKNLYTAWTEFLKKAQEFEADVVLFRTGKLSDSHGFVKIVFQDDFDGLTLFDGTAPHPVKDEEGFWKQVPEDLPQGSKFGNWLSVAAAAVIAGDQPAFDGVKMVPSTHFMTNTNLFGSNFHRPAPKSPNAAAAAAKFQVSEGRRGGVDDAKSKLKGVKRMMTHQETTPTTEDSTTTGSASADSAGALGSERGGVSSQMSRASTRLMETVHFPSHDGEGQEGAPADEAWPEEEGAVPEEWPKEEGEGSTTVETETKVQ